MSVSLSYEVSREAEVGILDARSYLETCRSQFGCEYGGGKVRKLR